MKCEQSTKIELERHNTSKDSRLNSDIMPEDNRLRSTPPKLVPDRLSPPHDDESRSEKEVSDRGQSIVSRSASRHSSIQRRRNLSLSPSSSRRAVSRDHSRNRRSPSHRSTGSRCASSSYSRVDRSASPKIREHKGFPSEKGRSPKKAVAIVPPRKRSPVE